MSLSLISNITKLLNKNNKNLAYFACLLSFNDSVYQYPNPIHIVDDENAHNLADIWYRTFQVIPFLIHVIKLVIECTNQRCYI